MLSINEEDKNTLVNEESELIDDFEGSKLFEKLDRKLQLSQNKQQSENAGRHKHNSEKLNTAKSIKPELRTEDVFDKIFEKHLDEKDYQAIKKNEEKRRKEPPHDKPLVTLRQVHDMSEIEKSLLELRLSLKQNKGTLTDPERQVLKSLTIIK